MNKTLPSMRHHIFDIVVPVYNTDTSYLYECLSSLDQASGDYGVIIVNDGSNVVTSDFLVRFVADHESKFHLITQENMGQNAARNVGWQNSDADYILFVDSDDVLVDGAIPLLVEALRSRFPDLLLYGFTSSTSAIAGLPHTVTFSDVSKRALIAEQSSLWGLAISRSQLVEHPLVEGFHVGEDFASVLPIIAGASTIMRMDANLYCYRIHKGSVLHSSNYCYPFEIIAAFDSPGVQNIRAIYPSEVEWQAIKHLLFWEPLRLIDAGIINKAAKTRLFAYMRNNYPTWKSNPYLNAEASNYGLYFYLTTHGFWGLCRHIKCFKSVFPSFL